MCIRDRYKTDTVSNSGEINVVLECKVVSRESVDEGTRVCVDNLEGQRADFPQVYCEMECSQVFYEDRVSLSLIHI